MRGKTVKFGARKINDVYELKQADLGEYKVKGYKLRNWLA